MGKDVEEAGWQAVKKITKISRKNLLFLIFMKYVPYAGRIWCVESSNLYEVAH